MDNTQVLIANPVIGPTSWIQFVMVSSYHQTRQRNLLLKGSFAPIRCASYGCTGFRGCSCSVLVRHPEQGGPGLQLKLPHVPATQLNTSCSTQRFHQWQGGLVVLLHGVTHSFSNDTTVRKMLKPQKNKKPTKNDILESHLSSLRDS